VDHRLALTASVTGRRCELLGSPHADGGVRRRVRWLPISAMPTWRHLVPAVVALATYGMPAFMRLTRAGMLEVLAPTTSDRAGEGAAAADGLLKHALAQRHHPGRRHRRAVQSA